jgi:predicted ferric reductase
MMVSPMICLNMRLKNPCRVLKASVDGPYGSVPDFTQFDKVIFIAGGSGASFYMWDSVEYTSEAWIFNIDFYRVHLGCERTKYVQLIQTMLFIKSNKQ